MKTARDYFDYKLQQMDVERSSWIDHWKELNKNFQPRRGKFDVTDRNRGNKRNQLPNNTALFAKRTLAAGMLTGITSPARPWFKLSPPDPGMDQYGPVRTWLDFAQNVMNRVFNKSGLYRALPPLYEECGVIGCSPMLQEEDFENVTRFKNFTVGEYYLGTDFNGKVIEFGREFQVTVYQLIEEFGMDNVSGHVQNLYDSSNYNSWIDVRHIIEPNDRKYDGLPELNGFPYRSVYYETGERSENTFLSVKGYHSFPIHAPRWHVKPGDTYGISPGMDALGDGISLQIQEKEKGKAVAKMVSPPTKAPHSLKNDVVSLLPGANTFTDDPNDVFKPIYQVNPRVTDLREDIIATEQRINRAFYVDLFLMIANDPRQQPATATEIAQRHEEKLLQLGSVLENMNDELLEPLIDRTLDMLIRASEPGWRGMTDFMVLPPPPQELMDADLKIEFVSILAQAQKMITTGSTERWVAFVGNVAAIGKPNALDKINEDEVVESMAHDLGVPNKVVRTDKEVAAMRKERQQQEQSAQAMQMVEAGVGAAKTLGDTPSTGGNVLNDVLGVGAV